ncbi:hypothetical protein GR255_22895 [Mycobacterium tuberculosis]|nr:hypothetical protein [Mycobacterium tuberculosis]
MGTSLIAASTLLTPPVYYGLAGSAASFASAFLLLQEDYYIFQLNLEFSAVAA